MLTILYHCMQVRTRRFCCAGVRLQLAGLNKGVTALIAFAVSLAHFSGLAACQSVYLLAFFPDRAAHSFGLGHLVIFISDFWVKV